MKILTIFRKDVRLQLRNAQLLMALVVPLGLGILYNVIFPDTTQLPRVTVAYSARGHTALLQSLRNVTHRTATLQFRRESSAQAVKQAVKREKADVGIVLPPGFDRALKSGKQPALLSIVRDGASASPAYVAATLEPALRIMAGQHPPATIQQKSVPASDPNMSKIVNEVGVRSYFVLAAMFMLIIMMGVYVLPTMLTEETEKRTLDALVMIASYGDVISAKALVGLLYVVVAVPLLLVATQLMPGNLLLFAAAIGLFSVSLVGMGLLLGGIFRTAAQINTWSSVFMLPMIFGTMQHVYSLPRVVDIAFSVLPSSQALKLALNGLSGKMLFADMWLSVLVVLAWGVAAYGGLWWRLQHREA